MLFTQDAEDARLLEHYLARGHEPWNVSLEAAWLDFELRRHVSERLVRCQARHGRPLRVLNVGIGVGLWDDWLGYVVGAGIPVPDGSMTRSGAEVPGADGSITRGGAVLTSIDIDCDICEVFELRQRREKHPFPARVVCGDLDALAGEEFDFITCIGSTLEESGAPEELRAAMRGLLAPGGELVVGDVRPHHAWPGVSLVWRT